MTAITAAEAISIARIHRAAVAIHEANLHAAPDLLDAAGAGPADRVLLVRGGADLLCSAARHGCRSALAVTAMPKRPDPVDLVVAPASTVAEADTLADASRRALAAGGRLALLLRGATEAALRGLRRSLRAYGFARIRAVAGTDGAVILLCHRGAVR